jgi:hypothetical protein
VTLNVTPATIPVAPTLTLAATSITVGASTTITWSSLNGTGCTASGAWSGALASSGTQTVSPTTVGANTYSLVCANSAGTSPSSSALLTVNAAPSGGGSHGGGALDWWVLAGLGMLGAARFARSPKQPGTR